MSSLNAATLEVEHPGLIAAAIDGIEAVEQMPSAFSGSSWMPDWKYAQRARHLAGHLRQIVAIASVPAYPSALALCRIALEHHLLDELLLHGTVYRRIYTGVDDSRFAEWEADLAAQTEAWTSGVRALERRGRDRAAIVREGFDVRDDDGAVVHRLSPYYVFTQEHQPMVGRPGDQADDGIVDVDDLRDHARRNENLYRSYLSWSAMRDNLVLNELYTDAEIRRVEVHYRFLSMYVHATNAGYDPFRDGGINGHNHYFGELVLLYVIWLASSELDTFARYLDTRGLDGVDHLRDVADHLAAASAHLWPPKGSPHAYDRWNEANRLRFMQLRADRRDDPPVRPNELTDDEVSYYSDPLARLKGLHSSAQELMTGFSYVSPWPRSDGHLR